MRTATNRILRDPEARRKEAAGELEGLATHSAAAAKDSGSLPRRR